MKCSTFRVCYTCRLNATTIPTLRAICRDLSCTQPNKSLSTKTKTRAEKKHFKQTSTEYRMNVSAFSLLVFSLPSPTFSSFSAPFFFSFIYFGTFFVCLVQLDFVCFFCPAIGMSGKMKLFTSPSAFFLNGIFICLTPINNRKTKKNLRSTKNGDGDG